MVWVVELVLTLVGVLRPEGGSAFHFLYFAFLTWKSATMTIVQTTMIPMRAAKRMRGVERAWRTWMKGRGSREGWLGWRGSARWATRVKAAKHDERLVARREEWSSRRSKLPLEVIIPPGELLLVGKTYGCQK